MHLATLFTLISSLAVLVTAAPTLDIPDPFAKPSNSCAGATLFRAQGNKGGTLGWDFVTVPASAECTDLDSVFGNFIDQTRSLTVEFSRKCWFYTERRCTKMRGDHFELGEANEKNVKMKLSNTFDRKIKSVWCGTKVGQGGNDLNLDPKEEDPCTTGVNKIKGTLNIEPLNLLAPEQ